MTKKAVIKKIVLAFISLVLVLVMIFSGLQILESTVLIGEKAPEAIQSKTIIRNGIEYFPKQDVTVVMVLGIDQFGPVESSETHKNSGSADMVMLLIFDEKKQECTVLQINRDTMVEIPVKGVFGETAGTSCEQLALAHTYGSGMADSSENVKKTLENFLPGASIDYYVSVRMDGITILNDAVGGVKVTVVDDFSDVNPTITKGEITLKGDQVIDFVRTRKGVGDQKNTTRMQRQKEYIGSLLETLRQKKGGSVTFFTGIYEKLSPYMVTDCSAETLNSLFNKYADYTVGEVVTPAGESVIVDGFYQFHADEKQLDDMLLELFYSPK